MIYGRSQLYILVVLFYFCCLAFNVEAAPRNNKPRKHAGRSHSRDHHLLSMTEPERIAPGLPKYSQLSISVVVTSVCAGLVVAINPAVCNHTHMLLISYYLYGNFSVYLILLITEYEGPLYSKEEFKNVPAGYTSKHLKGELLKRDPATGIEPNMPKYNRVQLSFLASYVFGGFLLPLDIVKAVAVNMEHGRRDAFIAGLYAAKQCVALVLWFALIFWIYCTLFHYKGPLYREDDFEDEVFDMPSAPERRESRR